MALISGLITSRIGSNAVAFSGCGDDARLAGAALGAVIGSALTSNRSVPSARRRIEPRAAETMRVRRGSSGA
jgi:hypothetical protein